jgi:hypothetical protein
VPCGSGEACVVGGDEASCLAIPAPRPVAPLSTATATSQRPSFRWALPVGADGAQVDVCRDRACTSLVTHFAATGTSGRPPTSLSAGVYYWRLRGSYGGALGTQTSVVWEFVVGARSAPVDTSWGSMVDVNGDGFADAVIGAPYEDRLTGAVYVFTGSATGLSASPTVLAAGTGIFPEFGFSVASAGDVNGDGFGDVIVGSTSQSGGAAYLYWGSASGLVDMPTTIAGPLFFGRMVSGAGDVNGDGYADVLVLGPGAPMAPFVANLYFGGATGLSATPTTLSAGSVAALASAGDVNGDGFADIVLGNGYANDGRGEVDVYLGTADGPGAPIALAGPIVYGYFGYAMAGADVNGDGYADLLVGAPGESPTFSVYLGSPSGPSTVPATFADPANQSGILSYPSPYFGACVSSAGDVNGDGFGDVVVGSDGVGVAYLYLGAAAGLPAAPLALKVSGSGEFGESASAAGDVNGDGIGDLLVGAPSTDGNTGAAYLYLGSQSGHLGAPTVLIGPSAMGGFGYSL